MTELAKLDHFKTDVDSEYNLGCDTCNKYVVKYQTILL